MYPYHGMRHNGDLVLAKPVLNLVVKRKAIA